MNKYVVKVKWDHPLLDGLPLRDKYFINEGALEGKSIPEYLENEHGFKVKSYEILRIIQDLEANDEVLSSIIDEVDMNFVQILITAINESDLPALEKATTRSRLDNWQNALANSNRLVVSI